MFFLVTNRRSETFPEQKLFDKRKNISFFSSILITKKTIKKKAEVSNYNITNKTETHAEVRKIIIQKLQKEILIIKYKFFLIK